MKERVRDIRRGNLRNLWAVETVKFMQKVYVLSLIVAFSFAQKGIAQVKHRIY